MKIIIKSKKVFYFIALYLKLPYNNKKTDKKGG